MPINNPKYNEYLRDFTAKQSLLHQQGLQKSDVRLSDLTGKRELGLLTHVFGHMAKNKRYGTTLVFNDLNLAQSAGHFLEILEKHRQNLTKYAYFH